MVYVDNYPDAQLGEQIAGPPAKTYKVSTEVTKGQVVVFVAAALDLPTIAPAGDASALPAGVALESGAVGKGVAVSQPGAVVKVRAGAAIAAGALVVTKATGLVDTVGANTMEKVLGRALQEAVASGDDLLIQQGGM